MKWEEIRLGDLGRVITGRTPPSSRSDAFGTKYPFITPTDMDGRRKMDTTERYLSDEGAQIVASCRVPAGSIAVSCIGWQMGKSVITTHPSSFTNQQLNTIIPNARVHAYFLYYALSTRQQELKNLGSGGTRTPILNKSRFEDVRVRLPPLLTQRRIADILSAYDDLIENNTKRIKILEEMARSLYREWFVNFRFPGHEKVKMVSSPLGKVPEGWEVVELGALVDDLRDSVDPAELAPDTPYFGLEHLPRRSLALGDWGQAADVQSTKLRVRAMDILFGKIRPYFHKVGPSPVDGVCSSDTIVLRVRVAEHYGVVLATTSSDDFVSHATQTSQGTKMPRANWDVLRRYAVSLPPPALLRRFNAVLTDNVTLIHALLFKNRNLSATRDLVLPPLISGEVEVEPHA